MNKQYRAKAIIPGQGGSRTVVSAVFFHRKQADDQAVAWLVTHGSCSTVVGLADKVRAN